MPIYEYACRNCRGEFELLVRTSEEPTCPICRSHHLHKHLSVPAAHTAGTRELPICPPSGSCGRPQCGTGGCALE